MEKPTTTVMRMEMGRPPTYVFMTVDYTEQSFEGDEPTPEYQAAVRATYRGVRLRVEYGRVERTVTFNSGEFATDYNAALDWFEVETKDAVRPVPFMGSSTVDHYMFDAGYEE